MKIILLSILTIISFCSIAQQQFEYSGSAFGTDTYTVALTNFNGYQQVGRNVNFSICFANDNTGAATLNVSGPSGAFGAESIVHADGSPLDPGDIQGGSCYRIHYNGSDLVLGQTDGGATGDVAGPASSTDGAPALFDGTTGKLLKNSTPTGTGNPVMDNSPVFSGTPSLPTGTIAVTQTNGDNSTKPATTAYADAKVAASITNGVTTSAPNQDQVFDALANNSATDQAFALALVGTYTRLASINQFASVDPSGVTECSAAIQAGLNNSSYDSYIFDGVYKITSSLTIPTGKRVYLRAGTDVQVFTGAAGNVSAFILNTRSGVDGEQGSFISCTASTKNQYGITVTNGAYGWSVLGRIEIRNFGRHGMYFLSAVSAPNQYKTGTIVDVIVSGTSAITGSYGDGIKVDGGTEYVRFINVESTGSAGYGLNILGANNPVIGGALVANTTGGMRVQGGASNSDHSMVTGTTINHNTGPAFTGVDIDTGYGLTGVTMLGNSSLFNLSNCQGVSFTGCGVDVAAASALAPGATGDGLLTISKGYSLSGSQADFRAALTGGGQVIFDGVTEVLPSGYTSYTANFSAGVDSWTDSGTTGTGNNDAVSDGSTSFSDCLRIAGDGASSTHYMNRATTLTNGAKYRLSITVYMPTANSAVDGFEIGDSGTLALIPTGQVKGKWVTYDTGEFTATGTSLRIRMKSNSTDTFTAPSTDYIYVGRLILKAL